jgi:hypothetical protein
VCGLPGAVYLEGVGLTLNTIEEEDLTFLRDTINDPAVRAGLLYRPPLNVEQERDYFETVVSDDGSVNLLVCVDGEPAGTLQRFRPFHGGNLPSSSRSNTADQAADASSGDEIRSR